MSASEPLPTTGVIGQLLSDGYRFNFFQAVRLLEMSSPERSAVGRAADPRQEVVRFESLPSVEFPASQIQDVFEGTTPDDPTRMVVTFFGLAGPLGALPQHYTEIILDRIARKDRTLQRFFDLFNHRLISLFYRAWEKYRFWIVGERMLRLERSVAEAGPAKLRSFVLDQRPQLDPLGEVLLCLAGLGSPAARYVLPHSERLQPRTEIPDQTWRYYAGLISQRRRPAVSLQGMLADHFGWPVKLLPLCGRWLQLEPADQTRLRLGCNSRLGVETVAGRKVWEIQGKFRLRIGALSYAQFCDLLPIGTAHAPFVQLTRFYAGAHLDFDCELLLKTSEIPRLRCGDKQGIGPRLGWNTWLPARQRTGEAASVVLQPREA